MPIKRTFALPALLLWVCLACSTREVEPELINPGKDFLPVKVGNFWEYRVDTVDYRFSGDSTSGTYYLREVIADSMYRQEGSMVYRLEIFRRPAADSPWKLDSVWTLRADPDKILRTENNRPFVRLRFPLREGSRWDGNAFNTLQDSNSVSWYTVRNLDKPLAFRGEARASVEIVQKRDSNCLNKSEFSEVYMRNVGLYSRVRSYIQYSQDGPDPCGQIPKIEIGYKQVFILTDFGIQP